MIGIVFDPSLESTAFRAACQIRDAGVAADIYFGRSYQSQMRLMQKKGYGICLLFRDDGVFSKDMNTGEMEPSSVSDFTPHDFY